MLHREYNHYIFFCQCMIEFLVKTIKYFSQILSYQWKSLKEQNLRIKSLACIYNFPTYTNIYRVTFKPTMLTTHETICKRKWCANWRGNHLNYFAKIKIHSIIKNIPLLRTVSACNKSKIKKNKIHFTPEKNLKVPCQHKIEFNSKFTSKLFVFLFIAIQIHHLALS